MIMKYNFESIGNFELTQPIMRACDPRQGEDGAAIFLSDCKLGTWEASVARVNDPCWGHYVAALAVRHIDGPSLSKFKKINLNLWGSIWDKIKVFVTKITTGIELYPDDLYVASGQAGFFDEAFCWDDNVCKDIGKDVSWDLLCWEISNGEGSCGVIPYGVVSESGVESESGYLLYYMVKDHQVVAAMIKFVEDKSNPSGIELCE